MNDQELRDTIIGALKALYGPIRLEAAAVKLIGDAVVEIIEELERRRASAVGNGPTERQKNSHHVESDLKALRERALRAGSVHRRSTSMGTCTVCGVEWPCSMPLAQEPEIEGDEVLALLDRIEAAEETL